MIYMYFWKVWNVINYNLIKRYWIALPKSGLTQNSLPPNSSFEFIENTYLRYFYDLKWWSYGMEAWVLSIHLTFPCSMPDIRVFVLLSHSISMNGRNQKKTIVEKELSYNTSYHYNNYNILIPCFVGGFSMNS